MFIGVTMGGGKTTLMKPVDYIITIENPTSFWRYCTEIGCYRLTDPMIRRATFFQAWCIW